MKIFHRCLLVFLAVFTQVSFTSAQKTHISGFEFTIEKLIKTSPVKNQSYSSTCWCFATVSFIETELIRKGKGEFDLSEMYIVHNTWPRKAEQYIRMQGYDFFTPGGQAHDVLTTIAKYGFMPESVYSGLIADAKIHDHTAMDKILKSIVDTTAKKSRGGVSANWITAVNKTLDSCLGKVPDKFNYNNKTFTPLDFMKDLQFNPDDYIEITSYNHHPYNSEFVLEDKFNWTSSAYYNVSLTDFMTIIDSAISKGYSVVWDGDVSEKDYYSTIGIAVVPFNSKESSSSEEKNPELLKPGKEKTITAAIRQTAFDDHSTTVDHLMHIVGKAKDQNGTVYYIVKNSWGTWVNDGYVYLSKSYIELKTVAIMLNRQAVPEGIKKNLGIIVK